MQLVQALLGLTLVAWLVCQSEQFGTKTMGPYDFVVEQVSLCEDQGNGKGNFNISMYLGAPDAAKKRPHVHRGSFSWPFTKEQGVNMEVEGDFYQKKNNDFLLMYNHKDNLCKTMTEIVKPFYDSLRKVAGIKTEDCSIDNGDYAFSDWMIPFELPTPMLEYGTYRATVRMLSEKEVFGCVYVLGVAKPKQKK